MFDINKVKRITKEVGVGSKSLRSNGQKKVCF